MGPGSVIGVSNVLNYEEWTYRARPLRDTEIIEIDKQLLYSLMKSNEKLNKHIEDFILE